MINIIKNKFLSFIPHSVETCKENVQKISSKATSTINGCAKKVNEPSKSSCTRRGVSQRKWVGMHMKKHEIGAALCFILAPLMVLSGLYAGGILTPHVAGILSMICLTSVAATICLYCGGTYKDSFFLQWLLLLTFN